MSRTAKNLLGVCAICALAFWVDIHELLGALSQLTLSAVLGLALLAAALIYVSALKWGLFLNELGARESTLRLFALYLVGYFVNLLLPSYVGGDALRSWYVGKNFRQHDAAAATILERYTGLVAMVALALVFVWFPKAVSGQVKAAVLLVAFGVAALTIMARSARLLQMLSHNKRAAVITPHLLKVQACFAVAAANKKLLLKALALSFLYHSLTVVNTMMAAYAVGWYDAPLLDLFVVLPLILLIGALPLTPQGLGIQEGAFYFFLHGVGATSAQALGVALVLRAKSYVLALIGGVIWLNLKKEEREISAYSPPSSAAQSPRGQYHEQ